MVTNNSIIKNVAVYLRISRDKGENVDTLQNHRERLVRLCEDRGYTHTVYEEIISGQARMEAREALNSLLNDLEKYDAVVVTAIDRLSRDLEYSIHIFKRLEKVGIPVITPERIYTEQDFTLYAIESTLAHGVKVHFIPSWMKGIFSDLNGQYIFLLPFNLLIFFQIEREEFLIWSLSGISISL